MKAESVKKLSTHTHAQHIENKNNDFGHRRQSVVRRTAVTTQTKLGKQLSEKQQQKHVN